MQKIKKPNPSNVNWYAEPNLGSYFDNNEIKAVLKCLKNSNKWYQGFNPTPVEIDKFERENLKINFPLKMQFQSVIMD